MANERLSLLQKHILGIYQEESRKINNKDIFGFRRVDIAKQLQRKTRKTYWIPRRPRYAQDSQTRTEIMQKMFLVAQTEAEFHSGKINNKTSEKVIKLINDSLSPEAEELLKSNKDSVEYRKDYNKQQVSLTRSLKSLAGKDYLRIEKVSYGKLVYFITEKGLQVKLGKE